MALTKTQEVDKVEIISVSDWKVVQVREKVTVMDGDTVVAQSNQRSSINPDDDWTSYSAEIQAYCAVAHTQTRIDAYVAAQASPTPSDGE